MKIAPFGETFAGRKGVFLQLQRPSSEALRGFIAQRPLERRVGRLGATGHLAPDAVQ